MAGNISMGFAGDQDLVYGFDPRNVAERLTSANWKRKAIMRQDRRGLLYVWVGKGKQEVDGKKQGVYIVDVERLDGKGGRDYKRIFDNVEDALRYTNGEDRSALSRYSRPMGKMILNERCAQLLGAHPAPTMLSVRGMGHKVEIPGPDDDEGQIQPDGYACFLTEVLESILAVSPAMSKYVYKHGITLHPDVEGRESYGRDSDLPERITVRCYKSEDDEHPGADLPGDPSSNEPDGHLHQRRVGRKDHVRGLEEPKFQLEGKPPSAISTESLT